MRPSNNSNNISPYKYDIQFNEYKSKPSIIIPKIKMNQSDENNRQQSNNYHQIVKKEPVKQTPGNISGGLGQASSSIGINQNSKNSAKNKFPKQQDLQKMSKKQLAYTYYEQCLRLHIQNDILNKQLSFVRNERDQLYKRFNELKQQQKESDQKKPKRHRRGADQISRQYLCPAVRCNRSYGSEGSLIQHIKIKHEQYSKSAEYEQFLSSRKQQEQQKLIPKNPIQRH